MNILICNDDGVHAEGLKVLYKRLKELGKVTVVAPLTEQSATGQSITLNNPLRLEKIRDDFYGVSGYPSDCVIMALTYICKERPDVVISGINRGANLGQDIYYSGTVSAARQAVFDGIPGISVSTVLDSSPHTFKNINYQTAANYIFKILKSEITKKIPPLHLLNINVPNLSEEEIKGKELTELGIRYYDNKVVKRLDNRGNEYFWILGGLKGHCSSLGSDCNTIDKGKISVSLLNLFHKKTEMPLEWEKIL